MIRFSEEIYRQLSPEVFQSIDNQLIAPTGEQRFIESLKQQGDAIGNDMLSHISLLPYKHVLPNGTHFIDEG
jgi:hypothetical protein